MNYLNSVTQSSFSAWLQQVPLGLTDLQKRVGILAIALFAGLALWWIVKRCCCQNINASIIEDQPKDHQVQLDELLEDLGSETEFYKKIIKITGYEKDPDAYLTRWKTYKDNPQDYTDQVNLLFRKGKANTFPPGESYKWKKAIVETGILVDPAGYLAQWKQERGKRKQRSGLWSGPSKMPCVNR